jgi:TatA/E family protein of Tat protein translocase
LKAQMPFSGWEILIVAVIALIFFGYKYLPRLGRSAGEGARQLKEGAERGAATAKEYYDEQAPKAKAYVEERTPDAGQIGRTAGRHVREYRELKDEVMGTGSREEAPPAERDKPGAAKREEDSRA